MGAVPLEDEAEAFEEALICSVLDSETEGAEACIVGLKVRGPTSCPHMWLHGEAEALP